jgi:hypothetical protein
MSNVKLPRTNVLGLRVGDWIEVRSRDEILSTLDEQGCLDSLPFMPEMLQYCGKRFRVYKSAHKTCDTIKEYKLRRMTNAVYLESLRCDGEAHGGCQAGCLLFWKEAWLKPVSGSESKDDSPETLSETFGEIGSEGSLCNLDVLVRATQVPAADGATGKERYRCQATDLLQATTPLQWWDPRQYVKDLASRNVRLRAFVRYVTLAAFNVLMRLYPQVYSRLRSQPHILKLAETLARPARVPVLEGVQIAARCPHQPTDLLSATPARGLCYPRQHVMVSATTVRVCGLLHGVVIAVLSVAKRLNSFLWARLHPYPYIHGLAPEKTPSEVLNLHAGELVQVRSKDEIMRTINGNQRNRGLSFDVEMLPYCDKTFRVLRRVERIIDEKTGKMIRLPNSCLILDGVTCSGCVSTNRLFCPRSIYPYWHEIWLKRVDVTRAESGTCAAQLR